MPPYLILIIDRNVESAEFLSQDLNDACYNTIIANTGAAAQQLLLEQSPDLILLDRNLDDIDGLKLCQDIHKKSNTKAIPIILMSSWNDKDDIIEGLDHGVVDYIVKPYIFPILSARIRSAVRIKEFNDDLREARDKAQASEHSKTMLLANMSHEMRTPLNGILGLTSLLKNTELNEQQQQYIETIHSSGDLMLELINNILDYSKLENNRIEIEDINFNLTDIIKSVMHITEPSILDKTVKISTQIDSRTANKFRGDPNRIRQVLLNLLSNAMKFTKKGQIEVIVDVIDEAEHSQKLKVSVKDSGIGLTDKEQQRLFQPYQQANKSTSRKYGGTGLGLAICKQTIELMKGQIGVDSELGHGATFWFTLNIDIDLQQQLNVESYHFNPHDKDSINGLFLGKRILIVEDNITNQLVTSALLKPCMANLVIAENGKQCLDKLLEDKFDLILMDGQMPLMDGFEASKAIRQDKMYHACADIPIIAMTANAMAGDRDLCIKAGMNDYLSKPIDPVRFYKTIHKWLA